MAEKKQHSSLLLFDLDDTVTPKGQAINPDLGKGFRTVLTELKTKGFKTSILSTTGIDNATSQLKDYVDLFDYILVENGLVSFKVENKTVLNEIESITFQNKCNMGKMKDMINFAKAYMRFLFGISDLELEDTKLLGGVLPPKDLLSDLYKEYNNSDIAIDLLDRSGNTQKSLETLWKVASINFSPIGTNKKRPQYEKYREAFGEIDTKDHNILGPFRDLLEKKFGKIDMAKEGDLPMFLEFNIGGSTGVDIFPKGWNKTYGYYFMKQLTQHGSVINIKDDEPLNIIKNHPINDSFDHIIFFGDQALKQIGNDYAICNETKKSIFEKDLCIPVENPNDTLAKLSNILEEISSGNIATYIQDKRNASRTATQSAGVRKSTRRKLTKKKSTKRKSTRRKHSKRQFNKKN
jgi:hydroxymethylpyrimidine pyrophosphatase-like HAD family hydrolase